MKFKDSHSRLTKQIMDIVGGVERVDSLVEFSGLVDHVLKDEQAKLAQLVAANMSIFTTSNTDTSLESEGVHLAMDDDLAEKMDTA